LYQRAVRAASIALEAASVGPERAARLGNAPGARRKAAVGRLELRAIGHVDLHKSEHSIQKYFYKPPISL
jgi:hypothetical protein